MTVKSTMNVNELSCDSPPSYASVTELMKINERTSCNELSSLTHCQLQVNAATSSCNDNPPPYSSVEMLTTGCPQKVTAVNNNLSRNSQLNTSICDFSTHFPLSTVATSVIDNNSGRNQCNRIIPINHFYDKHVNGDTLVLCTPQKIAYITFAVIILAGFIIFGFIYGISRGL